MNETLNNRDLVRHLISLSSDSVRLMSTSKVIREQQPCASLWERWNENGCPNTVTEEREKDCLKQVGGHSGQFCVGTFEVMRVQNGWPVKSDASVTQVVEYLKSLLMEKQRASITTITTFYTRHATVTLRQTVSENTLIVRQNRNFRKVRCIITDVLPLLSICNRVGFVHLPCPATPIRVSKPLRVEVFRMDEEEKEYPLLSARRR